MQRLILLSTIIILLLVSCGPEDTGNYSYRMPEDLSDGLEPANLSDVGIDSVLIERGVNEILNGKYKRVHSILIYKDDRLIFEKYFSGHQFRYDTTEHHGKIIDWGPDSLHRLMSVTKSITSICVGIAVDKGYIKSVIQSIFDYLPEYKHLKNAGNSEITIEHLLTMTDGLKGMEWLVPYSNPRNDIMMTYFSEDPIAFVLDKPQLYKPGEMFQYYGGSNFVLGEIIRNASGISMDEFSGKYLFGPLGIDKYKWIQLNKGVIDGAGGLILTPREMVKIGATFLNGGVWKGKRIISEAWVDRSSKPYGSNSWMNNFDDYWGMKGYAYSWWTHSFVHNDKKIDMYYASGWGGQYIMVIPGLNMVAVFTGGNYITRKPSFEILKKYILPGIG